MGKEKSQMRDPYPLSVLEAANNIIVDGSAGFGHHGCLRKDLEAAKSYMSQVLRGNVPYEAAELAAAIFVLEGERCWNKPDHKRMKKSLCGRIRELITEKKYKDAAPYAKDYMLLFKEEPWSSDHKMGMLSASLKDINDYVNGLEEPRVNGEESVRIFSSSERSIVQRKAAVIEVLNASDFKSITKRY